MNKSTLDNLNVGDKGVVTLVTGGRTASRRLCEMGFNRGSEVKILKNDVGPLIVSLAGCKIALGWGLANKVVVQKQNN